MKTITNIWIAALTSLGTVPAQDVKLDSDTLAKAVVIEETEHDLQKAIELYRSIANSARTHPAVVTKANLRLGRALAKLGKKAEAAEAIAKAAKGIGPAAAQAQRLQGSSGVQDDKVMQLIGEMRKRGPGGPSTYSQELVWMGRSAAPMLIRIVDAESVDMTFVSKAALTLYNIGGPDVENWLERARTSYDVLKRRALIRMVLGEGVGGAVRAKVAAFVADKKSSVRVDTLKYHADDVPVATIVELLSDPAPEVREKVWKLLTMSSTMRRISEGPVVLREKVLDAIEKAESYVSHTYLKGAYSVLYSAGLLRDRPSRKLWFRALALPENLGAGGLRIDTNRLQANAHLEDVRLAVRTLGPVDLQAGAGTSRQRYLAEAAVALMKSWNKDAASVLLELFKGGYCDIAEPSLRIMLFQSASNEDWKTILDGFDKHLVASDIIEAAPANSTTFERLLPWVQNHLADSAISERDMGLVYAACKKLARVGTKESSRWIMGFMKSGLDHLPAVKVGRLERSTLLARLILGVTSSVGEDAEAMMGLVLAGGFGAKPISPSSRQSLVLELIRRKSEEAPAAVKIYFEGYKASDYRKKVSVVKFLHSHPRGPKLEGTPFEAAVIRAALESGSSDAWDEVWELQKKVGPKSPGGHSPFPMAVVCEFFEQAPTLIAMKLTDAIGRYRGEFVAPTLRKMLKHKEKRVRAHAVRWVPELMTIDAEMQAVLIGMLEDPSSTVVMRVVGVLQSYVASDKEVGRAIRGLLKNKSSSVRAGAILTLAKVDAEGSASLIEPLLTDEGEYVRRVACQFFERCLDRKYAPALIKSLKDSDEEVRKAAQKTLEAIRFYDQEKSRWERILGSTGLGSDPTEALVKQAQSKEQRIRIAAVRSLGTLGKAEVLPFLISLMQDADSEVAKAAELAVERINSTPRKPAERK